MENNKRLYRSESNRMIAGVCGGLGEFFGIDATLVRLVFVLFAFFGGGGIIAYLVMWLLVPTQSKAGTPPRDVPREGLEEMREGVERGARGAKEAYERWRGQGEGQGPQPPPGPQPGPPAQGPATGPPPPVGADATGAPGEQPPPPGQPPPPQPSGEEPPRQ
jgi:phage shock protein C